MSNEIRLILTTFSDENAAFAVVRSLLDERLIACGTLIPGVRSLYRWKGAIEESSEVQVLLKTSCDRAALCMARLEQLHPYEVPEIMELEPKAVSGPYAEWIRDFSGGSQENL
jgi:periplasmic divalent cation tolerance protein